jgi:hypothetical protein
MQLVLKIYFAHTMFSSIGEKTFNYFKSFKRVENLHKHRIPFHEFNGVDDIPI